VPWHRQYSGSATLTCSPAAYLPCVKLCIGCKRSRRLPLWVRPGFSLRAMAVAHRLCGMELGLRHHRSFACLTGFKGAQRLRIKDFGGLSKSTRLRCTMSLPTVAGLHQFVTERGALHSSSGSRSSRKLPPAVGQNAATAADVSRHCG